MRKLYPDRPVLHELSDNARLVVSEPIGELPGAWNAVPESSWGVVGGDEDRMSPFKVKPPVKSIAVPV